MKARHTLTTSLWDWYLATKFEFLFLNSNDVGPDYLSKLLDVNNLLGGQNIQHQVYNPYVTAYQWQQ